MLACTLADQACLRDSRLMSLLSDVADWFQIAGLPLALGALGVGLCQVIKAARTARVQVLLALDESLSSFEDIRVQLNPEPSEIEDGMEIRLRRYIAAFEGLGTH